MRERGKRITPKGERSKKNGDGTRIHSRSFWKRQKGWKETLTLTRDNMSQPLGREGNGKKNSDLEKAIITLKRLRRGSEGDLKRTRLVKQPMRRTRKALVGRREGATGALSILR